MTSCARHCRGRSLCRRRAGVLEKDGLNGEVWVGGVPGVLLLAEDGSISRRFARKQLPLGIVTVRRLPRCRCHSKQGWASRSSHIRTVFTEVTNAAGEMFGEQRLLAAPAGPTRGRSGRQGTCCASCRRPQPGRCPVPAARLRAKPLRGLPHPTQEIVRRTGPTPGKHGAAPAIAASRWAGEARLFVQGLATPVDAICTEVAVADDPACCLCASPGERVEVLVAALMRRPCPARAAVRATVRCCQRGECGNHESASRDHRSTGPTLTAECVVARPARRKRDRREADQGPVRDRQAEKGPCAFGAIAGAAKRSSAARRRAESCRA